MSFSNYGPLSTQVYNHTKKIGQSIGGDIEYYTERLKGCTGYVLEAMAGSGRVLIPLLEAGFAIEGVDSSAAMLAACQAECESRQLNATLYESTLENLALPKKYQAIIIPAGSFLLIEQREQSIQALQKMYNHLLPGGRLILDLELPDTHFTNGQILGTSAFHMPNDELITMECRLMEVDLLNQYKASFLRYEKWKDGTLVQTELQRFALRWYGVEEFRLVLERIGFTHILISADYIFGKYPTDAQSVISFEAIKSE